MSLPPPQLPPQPPSGSLQHLSPGTVNANEPLSELIPYKNGPALAGYHLGLFSFFPVLGLLLGITAIVLGVMGLRRANENPMVRGKGHVIAALICGGVFSLMNIAIIVVLILSESMEHPNHF